MEHCGISILISESQVVKYTTRQYESHPIETSEVSVESENEWQEEDEWIENMMFENFASYLETPLCIVDDDSKYESKISYIGAK